MPPPNKRITVIHSLPLWPYHPFMDTIRLWLVNSSYTLWWCREWVHYRVCGDGTCLARIVVAWRWGSWRLGFSYPWNCNAGLRLGHPRNCNRWRGVRSSSCMQWCRSNEWLWENTNSGLSMQSDIKWHLWNHGSRWYDWEDNEAMASWLIKLMFLSSIMHRLLSGAPTTPSISWR